MAIHNEHKGFDDTRSVLADGCERCEQHSADPFNALGDGGLNRLVQMAVDEPGSFEGRTLADHLAIRKIRETLTAARRIQRLPAYVAYEAKVTA